LNTDFKTAKHAPTLPTIKLVEETIKTHSGEFSKTELWKALPKKMMYQTFKQVINYLEESGKIMIMKNRKVIWVFNPELFKKIMNESYT